MARDIDLGLELLSALRKPGWTLTHGDIALWCDCTRQTVINIENSALLKLRKALQAQGFGAEFAEELRRKIR